ncbi:MAG: type II/IV secretion system protein [Candidatus Kerfeldbacteria bacterium]|nr:type II/IV secretion system protein [Candidatus Kerfeldbacteria bacterium]
MTTDFAATVLERLQQANILAPQQVAQVLQAQPKPSAALTELETSHAVTAEQIAKAKAEILNIQFVDLTGQQIASDVLEVVPPEIAENYQLVPFKLESGIVSVACVVPEDYRAVEVLDFIGRQQKLRFQYFSATSQSVHQALRQYGNLDSTVQNAIATTATDEVELATEDGARDNEVVHTAPVTKMVQVILKHAIEGQSSDVHIEPVGKESRVRYRVDGILHTSLVLPLKVHKSLIARIKVLANMKLDETRLPQDGRFKMRFEGRDVEFRVSSLPLLDNEKIVMRILDTSASVVTLEQLGFQDHNLERIKKHLNEPHGLILVTGPTGSGKSTSLYSMLVMLNKEGVNIITLEDPVEYNLPGIAQSQMHPEIGLTFANGLRSVLRQDPDIIMVGEIRDNETAELAIHAALTGHKVLSTLHTNDAFGAIPRLVDMDVEPFLVASALSVIVAQRLVRKICDHCKQVVPVDKMREQEITAEIKLMPVKYLPRDVSLLPPYKLYQGKGCTFCEDTGYRGRIAVAEVLENTKTLKKLIGDGQVNDQERVHAEFSYQGMFTLRQDGLVKALRGMTTLEEVWNATKS